MAGKVVIRVTIEGPQGSGKTAISRIIRNAFMRDHAPSGKHQIKAESIEFNEVQTP
jgi:hypothetical protein